MTREEAIEVYNGLTNTKIKEAFEFFATELAESEDEKIEKAIVDALLSHCNSINLLSARGYQIEDVKAWLEKQKERSSEDEDFINMLILHFNYLIDKGGDSVETYKSYIEKLKSLRPQPYKEVYQAAKHDLAIKFMNYLDENRPEGKMCLSNGECEDIDKAFKENDWVKIMRYVEKYRPHWKPSEDQMEALKNAVKLYKDTHFENFHQRIESLYEQLKKLM